MSNRHFKKNVEDFTCENCGKYIQGNGYTNHCPSCLYSKHVDLFPGDRKASCGGLMKPTQVLTKGNSSILVHTCVLCGHIKNNKMAPADTMETAIKIEQKRAYTQ